MYGLFVYIFTSKDAFILKVFLKSINPQKSELPQINKLKLYKENNGGRDENNCKTN